MRFVHRSARACPSRSLDEKERPVPREVLIDRGVAGDRPPPYGVWGCASLIVARGPVPRDLSISPSVAGDRPPPYGVWGCSPRPVARGPVPRDLSIETNLRCLEGLRLPGYGYFIFNLFRNSASNHLNREFKGANFVPAFKPVLIPERRGQTPASTKGTHRFPTFNHRLDVTRGKPVPHHRG